MDERQKEAAQKLTANLVRLAAGLSAVALASKQLAEALRELRAGEDQA